MDLLHGRRTAGLGGRHPLRALARVSAVALMSALTLFAWWLSLAAATGCTLVCDQEPQVWLGLILTGSVGATAGSTAWLAGRAVGHRPSWRSQSVVVSATVGVLVAVVSILSLRIG